MSFTIGSGGRGGAEALSNLQEALDVNQHVPMKPTISAACAGLVSEVPADQDIALTITGSEENGIVRLQIAVAISPPN